ncbi:MAG TPA: alpha/beta hydrolase [Agriterribacter sp.]|nr:alpha/beta hydrolase [Agriterribacter sp.]
MSLSPIVAIILCCITSYVHARNFQTTRFRDRVFPTVTIEQNISFKSHLPGGAKKKYFLLDLYQPQNDTLPLRPLILWMHGGGFKFGNKTSRGTPIWCRRFAERGYVCAAVNYRLSKKHTLSDFNALKEACANAVEDIFEAVAFFKLHHRQYRIDTNKIILAGNSAGAMIALQAVYSNPTLIRQEGKNGFNKTIAVRNPIHISAIVNFWGGIFDPDWLKNAHVPIVSVHGSKDNIVPPNQPEKGIYGSTLIHRYADSFHIPNRLKIFEGYAHELQKHFNPLWAGKATLRRLEEAGQIAASFLYEELFTNRTAFR